MPLVFGAYPCLRIREDLHTPTKQRWLTDDKWGRIAHACKMGLERIASKRMDSHDRSGRSPDWIKSKYPSAPAVKREAEED